ncbi:uncharacterized protein LOC106153441 [Lingula anatina]|uniref:Uncharacterized protein LOC106153441 n=1 Tax=Lingula anatina TaxID=7574 RepID=A0A2R2MPP8_LINAN|nr:uncharacterized protein LOC106153441 [Lingula anatina]|eukprot:XP_023932210.1 uncharacterized protein LOC106153441 [Lingula anatina]
MQTTWRLLDTCERISRQGTASDVMKKRNNKLILSEMKQFIMNLPAGYVKRLTLAVILLLSCLLITVEIWQKTAHANSRNARFKSRRLWLSADDDVSENQLPQKAHDNFEINKENLFLNPKDLQNPPNHVTIYDFSQPNDDVYKCPELRLRTVKTPICIYSYSDDVYISGDIIKGHIFERMLVTHFQDLLISDPHMQFIDIGANIGVWSLNAANMGRQVLAVEPFFASYRRFQRSVILGHYENNVTLVTNPISNKREYVTFKSTPGNKGGTSIIPISEMKIVPKDAPIVSTITLNDLVSVIDFKFSRAFLKIDIEGNELKALAACEELLAKIDIPFIELEWDQIRKHTNETAELVNRMSAKGYLPFKDGLVIPGYILGPMKNDTRWRGMGQLMFAKKSYIEKRMNYVLTKDSYR